MSGTFFYHSIVAACIFVAVSTASNSYAAPQPDGMRKMVEQLDKLDKLDFDAYLEKAQTCIRTRNFDCAKSHLAKAAKFGHGNSDKRQLLLAKQSLDSEIQSYLREQEEERRRREEEKRQREEEERRREEQEERERARARRQREEYAAAERDRAERNRAKNNSTNKYSNYQKKDPILDQLKTNNDAIYKAQRDAQEKRRMQQEQQRQQDRIKAEQEAGRRKALEDQRLRSRQAAAKQQDYDAQRKQQQIKAEQDAERKRAEQQERERQQKARELQEKERERQQELKRRQEQEERARKKEEAAAAKLAKEKAEKQEKEIYLRNVAAGIRLRATKCPDGQGLYYATGTRPRIKPEVVSCIDVQYRAYCPGSAQYSSGTARNFVGMNGCFGDTYDINPKPPCKVEEVRIEVVGAVSCR